MTPEMSGFADPSALVRPLDEEQARLVEILEAAGGEPVSFEQFRALGIENPAMLAYELEIAGFPIAHVHRPQPGGRPVHVGIRLERPWPAQDVADGHATAYGAAAAKAASAISGASRSVILASQAAGAASARTARVATARMAGKMPGGRERPALAGQDRRRPGAPRRGSGDPARWLLGAGVAALLLIGLIVLLAGSSKPSANRAAGDLDGSSARAQRTGGAQGQPTPGAAGTPGARAHRRSASAHKGSAGKSAAAGAPMDRATELQLAGHTLLEEGRYAAAISELRGALHAGGQSVGGCAEPTTPSCLTYAHALYDLGRALALDHAPAAAHAVLTERLRIDNQRGLVEKQLTLTRRQRHRASAPTRTPSSPRHQARPPSHEQPPPPDHPNPGGVEAPAATADGASHAPGSRERASA